jgi:hypothetical protein
MVRPEKPHFEASKHELRHIKGILIFFITTKEMELLMASLM